MKTAIIFSALLLALAAHADQTNWITAAPNFREVNGQLYNTAVSTNWPEVRCKFKNKLGSLSVFLKVKRVKTGEREVNEPYNVGLGSVGSGYHIRQRAIYEDRDGAVILVKNCPEENILTGREFEPRMMLVGNTNYEGNVVAIYDCGTPHRVAVTGFKKAATNGNSENAVKKPQ